MRSHLNHSLAADPELAQWTLARLQSDDDGIVTDLLNMPRHWHHSWLPELARRHDADAAVGQQPGSRAERVLQLLDLHGAPHRRIPAVSSRLAKPWVAALADASPDRLGERDHRGIRPGARGVARVIRGLGMAGDASRLELLSPWLDCREVVLDPSWITGIPGYYHAYRVCDEALDAIHRLRGEDPHALMAAAMRTATFVPGEDLSAPAERVRDRLIAELREHLDRESSGELRDRLRQLATETPEQRRERMQQFFAKLRTSQLPSQSRSAAVVMPEVGDRIALQFDANSRLELRRRDAGGVDQTCGSRYCSMPGPFTARAFGPHEILVAMATGNAGPKTTVLCFTRPHATADFEVTALAIVGTVRWTVGEPPASRGSAPHLARVVAWDPAAGLATVAFSWSGTATVAIGDVALRSTNPVGGVAQPPRECDIQAVLLGTGVGIEVEVLDVDGMLHAFVRRGSGPDRGAPVRVCFRDRAGNWSQPGADLRGLRVEPEFTAWRAGYGAVHLTTPVTTLIDGEPQQTLRTWSRDAWQPARWVLADRQFKWSGKLRLGQPLRVVPGAEGSANVVLQNAGGEFVECSFER